VRRGRRALDDSSSATIRPHCGDAPFGAYLEIDMKKKTKKLVLSKETVRDLNFGNAKGGWITVSACVQYCTTPVTYSCDDSACC
jgi:hypothetical protein